MAATPALSSAPAACRRSRHNVVPHLCCKFGHRHRIEPGARPGSTITPPPYARCTIGTTPLPAHRDLYRDVRAARSSPRPRVRRLQFRDHIAVLVGFEIVDAEPAKLLDEHLAEHALPRAAGRPSPAGRPGCRHARSAENRSSKGSARTLRVRCERCGHAASIPAPRHHRRGGRAARQLSDRAL